MGEHKSRPELINDLVAAAEQVQVDALYRHFRRPGLYRVLGFVISEATDGVEVRYSPVDEPRLEFARPLSSWNELKVAEGGLVRPRFMLVEAAPDQLGGDQANG